MKHCSSCHQVKPTSDFQRDRSRSDGLHVRCRECQRIHSRRYYESHAEEVLARVHNYREHNCDKVLACRHGYQARCHGSAGTFSEQEWAALKRRYKYRCLRCGAFEDTIAAPRLTPDHVVPMSRGGSNTIENIQPLCLRCNLWKGTKTINFRRDMEKVWMRPPHNHGKSQEFEAKPEVLVPLMAAGWSQCEPPRTAEEVNADVHD